MKIWEVLLAYKFHPYPNKEEERKLLWTMGICRRVFNRFLELYNASEHHRFKPQALMPMWK